MKIKFKIDGGWITEEAAISQREDGTAGPAYRLYAHYAPKGVFGPSETVELDYEGYDPIEDVCLYLVSGRVRQSL